MLASVKRLNHWELSNLNHARRTCSNWPAVGFVGSRLG